MHYLIIDAALNGTGIRDYYNGGYISPESLPLSTSLMEKLKRWLSEYEKEHYKQFSNTKAVKELDSEGCEIAFLLRLELDSAKVEYFSAALLEKIAV